jgi:hypothetical protein
MYKRKFAIVMSQGNFISGEFTRRIAEGEREGVGT